MAITKSTRVERLEVSQATGIISVRSQLVVAEDGVELIRGGYSRLTITPATPGTLEFTQQIDAVGDADDRQFVRRIANAVFTPAVVAAYQTSLAP